LIEQRLEQVKFWRSMTMTSTGALVSVLAAHNPPKPGPMMTTRCGVAGKRAADELAPGMIGLYAAPTA
jgi:hypothetical protein